jgi:hypothetical protein
MGLPLGSGRFVRKSSKLCPWELFKVLGRKDLKGAVPSEGGEGEKIYCFKMRRGVDSQQSVLSFRGSK